MREPFTVTETHRLNALEFNFNSFRELTSQLKDALFNGIVKRDKKYRLIIREVF